MSVSATALRELHRILRQLSDLRSRLEGGPRQIRIGETNVEQLEARVTAAKEQATKTRMSADSKELQLKEREGRISDIRTKLNSCSSNREYQAFIEQIAADEQANSVLSDEILELFDKVTEHQKKVTEAVGALENGQNELNAIRARVDTERESLENDLARLSKELGTAEDQLPGDLKLDYQRIIKKRGDEGLAPPDGECCGGCFTTITTQTLNELMLSQAVFCKHCGCLMYLPEDHASSA